MSENTYEYLKRRCEMLEHKVAWLESNMAQVSFKSVIRMDEILHNGERVIEYHKAKVMDGLCRTIADSKYIIHEDENTGLGREISATVYLFTGYKEKQKLFGSEG